MPKVWNKHHKNAPADAVYVGRPSKWGNPWNVGADGSRADVIARYQTLWKGRHHEIRRELRGKDLVCWCAPQACHADWLLQVANRPIRKLVA